MVQTINTKQVSIIIVNWNNASDTLACLDSLDKITYPNYHIILVDNGSTDNSLALIKAKYPKLVLISSSQNLGFSGGNNLGIKAALKLPSDYFLFLNNDTIVKTDFLSPLVKTLEENNSFGIAGPLIYYYNNPHKLWWAGACLDFFLNFHAFTTKPKHEITPLSYQTACCLLIKRDIVEKIGFFDERFFLYYEDNDLCARAKNKVYQSVLVASSKIYHKVSVSTGGENQPQNQYYYIRNKLLFAKKNLKFYHYLSLFLITGLKIGLESFFHYQKARYKRQGYRDFINQKWGQYEN